MGKTISITYSVTQVIDLEKLSGLPGPVDLDKENILGLFRDVPINTEDLDGAEPISIAIFNEDGEQIADWLL